MSSPNNIFTIPSGVPFLPTLVDSLLDGSLVGPLSDSPSDFSLCDVTIFVPTRRAMRELTRLFRERAANKTILLPMIRALGSADDADLYFSDFLSFASDKSLDILSRPISSLSRNLHLSVLVQHWARTMNESESGESGSVLSSTPSQCFGYAQDLSALLDQATNEGIDWSELDKIDCSDYSQWWQRTQSFLSIATQGWRKKLEEDNLLDESQLRIDRLLRQSQVYESGKYVAPVIAAGSTGSVTTTMRLLRSIASMDKGALVLPGLDHDLPEEEWQSLDSGSSDSTESEPIFSHPQYGLRHLLLGLDIPRESVRVLPPDCPSSSRRTFISRALIPSNSTGLWHSETPPDYSNACSGISLIEADDEHKEALSIALAMRESLEGIDESQSSLRAALITPDRNLARRVTTQLHRFGISIDDSAGRSLLHTPHGIFIRLIAALAFDEFDSVALLSLLQHRLCRFTNIGGLKLLELALLRGNTRKLSFGNLRDELSRIHDSLKDSVHVRAKLRSFTEEDWQECFHLCDQLDSTFTNIESDNLITSTIKLAELVSSDESGDFSPLYTGIDGSQLHSLFSDLADQTVFPDLTVSEFPDFLESLMYPCTVRPVYGTHPHLAILGPLEARLQNFDLAILGGLNERTWPSLITSDLFLSRSMKSQLGLPQPERRTGLAAHDFQMLMGFENVIITRSKHLGGAPTLASRWLQRLTTLAGSDQTKQMKGRGDKYLDWSTLIDEPTELLPAITPPSPCPPVEFRPRKLSISDIGRWIENPYEIYAKHILRLRPLDSLRTELGPMQRGLLFHDIFDEFLQTIDSTSDSHTLLTDISTRHFSDSSIPSDMEVLWRPRLSSIIDNFIVWHKSYYSEVAESFTEVPFEYKFENLDFTLTGRADRIDKMQDDGVVIYDYKTGTNPSINQVRDLQSPQLPLEALVASLGGFVSLGKVEINDVAYIRLRESDSLGIDYLVQGKKGKSPSSMSDILSDIYGRFEGLVLEFDDASHPYDVKRLVVPRGKFAGFGDDYAHLARTMEWSLSESDEESQT